MNTLQQEKEREREREREFLCRKLNWIGENSLKISLGGNDMSFLARDIQRKLTFDNSKSENSCEEEETEGEFEGKKSSGATTTSTTSTTTTTTKEEKLEGSSSSS